jgi:hypothetical protein
MKEGEYLENGKNSQQSIKALRPVGMEWIKQMVIAEYQPQGQIRLNPNNLL